VMHVRRGCSITVKPRSVSTPLGRLSEDVPRVGVRVEDLSDHCPFWNWVLHWLMPSARTFTSDFLPLRLFDPSSSGPIDLSNLTSSLTRSSTA
jgi:hypothetical protein